MAAQQESSTDIQFHQVERKTQRLRFQDSPLLHLFRIYAQKAAPGLQKDKKIRFKKKNLFCICSQKGGYTWRGLYTRGYT